MVEHIIAVGLRVLSGGRPKDQRHIIGSSRAAAYLAVDDFVDAVNLAPELNIDLPTTPEEWEEIYEQYKIKSSNEIMAGCVGAIDGFFQRTNKPTSKENLDWKRREMAGNTVYSPDGSEWTREFISKL